MARRGTNQGGDPDIISRQFVSFPSSISKLYSYAWLREFLIPEADTGVRFTNFGFFCMAEAQRSDHSPPTDELPDELYIGFVDGLLIDFLPSVVLSAVAVTCGQIAAAIAAKSLILALAAPAPTRDR